MTPVKVNLVYVLTYPSLFAGTFVAQRISRSLGRLQTSILFSWGAVGTLTVMATYRTDELWTNPYYIIPISVLRTTMINSCMALRKSVMMDYVPKKDRAKWNSLDSITRFGWSGSAVLGGILVDSYGFSSTFLLTA